MKIRTAYNEYAATNNLLSASRTNVSRLERLCFEGLVFSLKA